MIRNDFNGKAVLVTGGTKGLGLAIGLAFGRLSAHVYLTNKWGSVDEAQILRQFSEAGAPLEPMIVQADAAEAEDTREVVDLITSPGTPLRLILFATDNQLTVHQPYQFLGVPVWV